MRGAPSPGVLAMSFQFHFAPSILVFSRSPNQVLGSGVEATLTQRVCLQITDSTLIQLSIHCPKLQALVSSGFS